MMLKISLNSCRKLLKLQLRFPKPGFTKPGFIKLSFIGLTTLVGLSLFMTGCGEDSLDSELLGNFTLDVPIAYVKRPIETLANPRNATNFQSGQPAGNLWLREYASATAPEKNITENYTLGCDDPNNAVEGDVSDPDVSYDGKKIVFAMKVGNRIPANPDPTQCVMEEATWSLYEYDIASDTVTAVIDSGQPILPDDAAGTRNLVREEGNDVDPAYLPDGRVVFSSDRQIDRTKSISENYGGLIIDKGNPLFDEGNNRDQREATMNLHVMPVGGGKTSISQITFNQSHDLNPSVLQNGKIIYSRWEHADRPDNESNFDIYQVNPDGTEQELLYGAHSHDTAAGSESVFLHPRQYPGSPTRIISTLMPRQGTFEGGELVYIDYENFAEINIPKITSSSSNASGQTSATGGRVPLAAGNSANGRYTTPFPLWDNTNRALVAWAPCKVIQNGSPQFCTLAKDMTLEPAPAEYGIWILDLDANAQRQMIFPEPGFTITDPVAVINRDEAQNTPLIIQDKIESPANEKGTIETDILDEDLVAANKGKLVIKSVYDTNDFSALFGNEAQAQSQTLPCVDNGGLTPGSLCATADESPDIKMIQAMQAIDRPARFLRIVKPAPTVDRENARNLREILGYIPIEPDGSVVVEVPANLPLGLEVLGVNGDLIQKYQIHNSWIQVKPGETKVCNGCHSSRNGQPALNQGATSSEANDKFVGTVLATVGTDILTPRFGETMAETRARVTCVTDCSSQKLRRDIKFDDVWQDPDVVSPNNEDLHFDGKFRFNLLAGIPIPTIGVGAAPCDDVMDASCRITYDYITQIQPIWVRDRPQVDGAGQPIMNGVPPDDVQVNYQCTSCHNNKDLAAADRVPAGQLDLTQDGPTDPDNNQITSFQELTIDDVAQELVGGVNLDDASRLQFDGVDANNNPQKAMLSVPLPIPTRLLPIKPNPNDPITGEELLANDPLLQYIYVNGRYVRPSNNSRNDGFLLNKMTQPPSVPCDPTTACYPGTANHNEMLDPIELRLIFEWIGTGARYTNDIQDATAN